MAPKEKHKWLLGIGLGSGMIAFSLKVILIVSFDSFPKEIIITETTKAISRQFNSSQSNEMPGTLTGEKKYGYTWEALPQIAPSPKNNPTTDEKVKLGRKLFFDNRLSADNTLSCASCHELSKKNAGTDGVFQGSCRFF